jgi:hypothetical protein
MINKSFIIGLLLLTINTLLRGQISDSSKNQILQDLANPKKAFTVLDFVRDLKLYEAIPVLENNIWINSVPTQLDFLRVLRELNSPNTHTLALAFLDSVDNYDKTKLRGETKLSAKAHVNQILFRLNDYSQADFLIQQLRVDPYDVESIRWAPELTSQLPGYKEEVKNLLLDAANNAVKYWVRFEAVEQLEEIFGAEMIPLYLKFFKNIEESGDRYDYTRIATFKYLCKYQYSDLENLIKEYLHKEPASSYKLDFVDTLLSRFGTPENLQFASSIAKSDTSIQESLKYALDDFTPPVLPQSIMINQMIDSLFNITEKAFTLEWIDNNTKDILFDYLENSKIAILNNDSLECKGGINHFKDKVDFEFEDSLNTTPNFVTKLGWQFLHYNAQYILDRLPEIPIETGITNYSILAKHSLWLEQNSAILTGNIGVNEAGLPPFLDSEVGLSVGISASTPAGFAIKGNKIKVKLNAVVKGDVYYNELENNGTISGSQNTPLELPLISSLPEFKSSSAGTENIVVPQNGQQILQPGSYGDILVRMNGRLILTGGEYNINNLTVGDDNQIIFQSRSEVKIAGKFDSGQGSYIGPEDTTTMSAKEIIFYVAGINGTNGNLGATPKAAKIGISNMVKANFYVPNGTLWIRQNSEAEGSFIGKDVDVGIGVKIELNSAF